MQKITKKASILIWSIFLSLIISVTFISISTKINKNIKNNYLLQNNIEYNNEIKNIINSWSITWIYTNKSLSNWEEIIFKNNNIIKSLEKWEDISIKIISDNSLTISILEWSPVNTSSWLIINNDAFSLTSPSDFNIYNLWWYSKIKISSDIENSFLLQYTNYKIIKQIWNKTIIKSKWKIKNF